MDHYKAIHSAGGCEDELFSSWVVEVVKYSDAGHCIITVTNFHLFDARFKLWLFLIMFNFYIFNARLNKNKKKKHSCWLSGWRICRIDLQNNRLMSLKEWMKLHVKAKDALVAYVNTVPWKEFFSSHWVSAMWLDNVQCNMPINEIGSRCIY